MSFYTENQGKIAVIFLGLACLLACFGEGNSIFYDTSWGRETLVSKACLGRKGKAKERKVGESSEAL